MRDNLGCLILDEYENVEYAKQCGLPIEEYDLASYKGTTGVVSKRFDKSMMKLLAENKCLY